MTYEVWQKRRRAEGLAQGGGAWFWTKSIVVTSLVTSLATVPFALYHFDRMAPLGLIANVLAMPIVSLVSAPLAGAALLAAPFGLASWPLQAFGWSLEAILSIAHVFSNVEGVTGEVGKPMPDTALILFSIGLVLGLLARHWRARFILAGVASIAGLISWIGANGPSVYFAPSGEVFLLGDGEPKRLNFADGDGLAPLRYSNLGALSACDAESCLIEHDERTIGLINSNDMLDCRRWERADIIFVSDTKTPIGEVCKRPTYTLEDARRANGLSFKSVNAGFSQLKKPDCTARPWRTCPQAS